MRSVLAIAGSDSSGGAGIQADIKTIAAHHMFAQTALTALTAQNTLGVRGVFEVPEVFVEAQIDAVFEDIRPDAVKIGMVSSATIVQVIADALERHRATHVVVDPVLVATSGADLARGGVVEALCERLFPLATVITPNIPEAEAFVGTPISSPVEQERAAVALARATGAAVLVKGGHGLGGANDVLAQAVGGGRVGASTWTGAGANADADLVAGVCADAMGTRLTDETTGETGVGAIDSAGERIVSFGDGFKVHWFNAARIDNPNTHGTGCTLSSALACELADGHDVAQAVRRAKAYVTGALEAHLDLGRGAGPLDHMWNQSRTDLDAKGHIS